MLQEKEVYLSANHYEKLACRTDLQVSILRKRNIDMVWKSLDDYIDAMYGWFDPSQFDKEALEELKIEYGNGPVVQKQPIVQMYIASANQTLAVHIAIKTCMFRLLALYYIPSMTT